MRKTDSDDKDNNSDDSASSEGNWLHLFFNPFLTFCSSRIPGDEFSIENWPISDRAQSCLREMAHTHIVNPLPVYEFKCNKDELKLVSPKDYEKKLL